MSEQETVQKQQSLANSVNELETLAQQALELDGEAREELVEQIKTRCTEEGLSSQETDELLEEIGLVQEARVVQEADNKPKAGKGESADKVDGDHGKENPDPNQVKGSGTSMGNPVKGKVGSHKGEISAEDIEFVNDYLKKNLVKVFGYTT